MEPEATELFDTPEAAALASWAATPTGDVQVLSVTIDEDSATVIMMTDVNSGFNTEHVLCSRDVDGRWFYSGSYG